MNDAATRFHNEWLGYVQPEGLVVSLPALRDAQCMERKPPSFQQKFLEACGERSGSGRMIADFERFTAEVLEWGDRDIDRGASLPGDLEFYIPEADQVIRPSAALKKRFKRGEKPPAPEGETPAAIAGSPYVALVWDIAEENDAAIGVDLDKSETVTGAWNYPTVDKFIRLLRNCRVEIGVLTNRREVRLIYAPHGEAPGWLSFDVDAMSSVGGRPILDAMAMLLSGYRLYGAQPEHQLPALLRDSRQRQGEVTNRLVDQVFDALQILLRGFERAAEHDPRYREILDEALERDGDHLYGGLLTVLLRLVFVLYAEDRSLMPVERPFYTRNFSVQTLFSDLQADHGAYPDSMSHRFGAWPRLLALFRAVFSGCPHPEMQMPARRGELFDPDRFPFLEGRRSSECSGDLWDASDVPSVDDECVFGILQRLMVLDGQRLSYRALEVEQIGSVYEALMGYHVQKLSMPAVCLKPDRAKAVWVGPTEILAQKKAQRGKWLKDVAGLAKSQATKIAKALEELKSDDEALEALAKFQPKHARSAAAGQLVIQPGPERKRTSSHYTPRSLTAPMVKRTLEPLIAAMNQPPSSDALLKLKICDPAMGSGAFLVETTRQLADALVAAWTREERLELIADEHEDVVNHARRLVAQRCVYGVDKNAFAVSLAKLSLWLVTLAKDEPFTFVDHALRHGDSLVGLDADQIRSFHWDCPDQFELCSQALDDALQDAVRTRRSILSLAASGEAGATREKYRLLQDAEDALDHVRLIGDLVVGAFFSSKKDKERQAERDRRLEAVESWLASGEPISQKLCALRGTMDERIPVFHWAIEYPEIFDRGRPDPLEDGRVNGAAAMDAFVGNLPFAGKNTIASMYGSELLDWLKVTHVGSHGNADYCSHFLRRADYLLGEHGAFGLIATNTVAQGDTRSSGLQPLLKSGHVLYDATSSMAWPGVAAVNVSKIHSAKGSVRDELDGAKLDDAPVEAINSRLRGKPERPDPVKLSVNQNLSFQGSVVLGMGFTLTPEARDALIQRDPRNAECIFPYLGGEEVNTSLTQSHRRYVINFGQMSLEQAGQWPVLLEIVREKVKPSRDAMHTKNSWNRDVKARWWQFASTRPALYEAISDLPQCLVNSRVSKHLCFTFQPVTRVFAETLYAFPLATCDHFAVLQSRVHEPWARLLSSSMKNDLRYAASDCFDTFAFPDPDPRATNEELEAVGQKLYDTRAAVMQNANQGLTQTYNRLKDGHCRDEEIVQLRNLHLELDAAVLKAYGWSDIDIPPFATPDDDDTPAQKQLENFKDEIIDRLFVLNAERAQTEAVLGQLNQEKKPTRRVSRDRVTKSVNPTKKRRKASAGAG